ncbi:MAG: hypothetical protein P1V35_17125 [Planctomycetota bacterium]|nr:hypothetical protein [Planctomycetota bacterium]
MAQPERTQPIYTPQGGPPRVDRPSGEILETVGEEGVFRILSNTYKRIGESPIRAMFADDLEAASRRSAAFFVQVMGGAPLYTENYGPPRMRMRHFPFEIDAAARTVWLQCFRGSLQEDVEHHGFPSEHLASFETFLEEFSKWMVNVEPKA